MKKKVSVIIAGLVVGLAYCTSAQENKVVSAIMHLKEYNDDKDTSALNDAKEAIDLAAANDKTKDEPKMWLNRGKVYRALYERQLAVYITKKLGKTSNRDSLIKLTMKYRGDAYSSIDTAGICIASNSFVRVIQLVPKDYYADEARQNLPFCSLHIENKAISDNDHQKYASALAMFEKAIILGQVQGYKDTSAFIVQNIQNCAITADKMNNTAKAMMYYQKLIDAKVGGPQPYFAMITMFKNMNDTAKELGEIKKGRAAYPEDVNLLISETNYYLASHNTEKAIGNLQLSIDKLNMQNKPEDKSLLSKLYFALGNTYDNLANPKDDKGKSLAKPANFDELFGKAEDNYTKAAALETTNFDLLFDFGALYNNRATDINAQANAINPDAKGATEKFNALVAQANDLLKKAQPWLEKAHALNPTDQSTITALKQIYAGTSQLDKLKELNSGK